MIAYNRPWLKNRLLHRQVDEAFEAGCVSHGEVEGVKQAYPAGFFTPNFFIKVGLFVLTLVIAIFSFGLFALIMQDTIEENFAYLMIFFGLLVYGVLELFIQTKRHYRSGVDDALMCMSAALLFGGLSFGFDITFAGLCLIAFFVTAYLALRYASRIMAVLAFLGFHGFLFFKLSEYRSLEGIIPFVLMASSAVVYFLEKSYLKRQETSLYRNLLLVIEVAGLMLFYAAGNYYVVRELSVTFFEMNLRRGADIPFGLAFRIFTVVIPVVYLVAGIFKKDRILLWCGMLAMAASVATIYHYYDFISTGLLLVICGGLLVITAWLLISWLKKPRAGFIIKRPKSTPPAGEEDIEALAIAENFGSKNDPAGGTRFGGGSFGGAGAGNDF